MKEAAEKGLRLESEGPAVVDTRDSSPLASSKLSPNSLSHTSSASLASELLAKQKEISELVNEIQRLQSTVTTLKETTASQISQLEEVLSEKNNTIKRLENKLDKQKDYEDIKRELSLLKEDIGQHRSSSNGDGGEHKPLELYLLEKTKALQSENAALKAANAELSGSLPRHLIPPFLPPLQNVEAFGSLLGEEIVNSYAKTFKREPGDHNSSTSPSRPASADDAKSVASDQSPRSSSAINCNEENNMNCGNSAAMATEGSTSSPTSQVSLQRLQECLRQNVEKYMNESLNTLNISRCVREFLSVHNIGQRLFAKYILGLSQGTVSELLSKPKPWDKLTEKGRDSYRKMHAWASDENCIYLLKSLVPRKGKNGKEASSLKQDDPAAEERIQQILNEAQRAMLAPNRPSSGRNLSATPNGEQTSSRHTSIFEKTECEASSDNGDERSDRRSPISSSSFVNTYRKLQKKDNDDIPPEMVARIYQAELAKLIGQQVEEGFRHPIGYERTQEEIRQAIAIYHQELSRLSHIASSGGSPGIPASTSEAFARFTAASAAASAAAAAAGLVNGANYLGLPQLLDPNIALDARVRVDKNSSNSGLGKDGSNRDSICASDEVRHHNSAFSLVRSKQDAKSSSNKRFCSSPSSLEQNNSSSVFSNANNPSSTELNATGAEDLSAAASPLQRMQSITNSLLTQSVTPSVPTTTHRPAKAVLPPITQQQFDQYNNLNTEDIVKRVKEQLSQYSISQRLFGESVLGLSQGSVSDLLARPKPWHMLTQKGREPFIRMKMFLEDENAVHKLVASQYKIAPEKLMRTGGFTPGTPSNASIISVTNQQNMSPNTTFNTSNASKPSNPLRSSDSAKSAEYRHSASPVFAEGGGNRSSGSTPEHTPLNASLTQSPPTGVQNYSSRRIGQQSINRGSYIQPSVYEMAALTTDLDTQAITTKIKETLMAHNIGQKIFGEVVLGLSQGSVSELLSKPKPWHMLSIKGREPFIRMQLWLTDPQNIEKLQTLKNERREANKRRRTNVDDAITCSKSSQDTSIYNLSSSNNNNSSNNYNVLLSSGSAGAGVGTTTSNHTSNALYGAPSAKKPRILFSEEQKEALRLAFSMDPYPSTATIEFLATELGLSVRTITNWFHNHRMRLKQVNTSVTDEGSLSGSSVNQLPYNLGRDGVCFDPIQFRVLLSQRLSDIKLNNNGAQSLVMNKPKYSSMYSSISSYCNPNSCSSQASSFQEEEMGTLDLSMSSQQNKYSNRSDDSDDSNVSGDDQDEFVELDLSRTSRSGSSRRKPQMVTSSSSRRKPAQPQWVDPGLEFSAEDEEEDNEDDDLQDNLSDSDNNDDSSAARSERTEIINGVCVRQTDLNILRRNTATADTDESLRVEPLASESLYSKGLRLENIKKLEKPLDDDDDWDDDSYTESSVKNDSKHGSDDEEKN
ncbi:Homeobox protein cut-like protein [Dinothrombium tinctorium]|uniref:Homeobox protein cut-like n=1 Tax=Dinothrombium tinctorium TaxID=1965070 RepID=A0A443RQJ5_9ACAR|nr:Homeobox protein cut-like protein [Dinothrombium tinctorium]